MKQIVYPDLGSAAMQMPKQIKTDVKKVVGFFHDNIHDDLSAEVFKRTPLGDHQAAMERVRRKGTAYGHMKGLWFADIGSMRRIPLALAAARRIKAGQISVIYNIAAHARVIEMGWQMATYTTKYRKKGRVMRSRTTVSRMIGSPKAPRGVARPAVDSLRGKAERLRRKAIREAEMR